MQVCNLQQVISILSKYHIELYLFHFVGIMRKLSDYVLHSFSKSIIIIK